MVIVDIICSVLNGLPESRYTSHGMAAITMEKVRCPAIVASIPVRVMCCDVITDTTKVAAISSNHHHL